MQQWIENLWKLIQSWLAIPLAQWLIAMFVLMFLFLLAAVLNRTEKRIAGQSWFFVHALLVILLCMIIASLGPFYALLGSWSSFCGVIATFYSIFAAILVFRTNREASQQRSTKPDTAIELALPPPIQGVIRYVEGYDDAFHWAARLSNELEAIPYNFCRRESFVRPITRLVEDLKNDCKKATHIMLFLSCRYLGKLDQNHTDFEEFTGIVSNNQPRMTLVVTDACSEGIRSRLKECCPIFVVDAGIDDTIGEILHRMP